MKKTRNTITQYVTVQQAREIIKALEAAIEEFEQDGKPSGVRLENPDLLEPNILISVDQEE